jgi:hypothetical protein
MLDSAEIRKEIHVTAKFKPGRYWIGDPCYIVPDESWQELLDSSEFLEMPGKVGEVDVVAFGTAYGDRVYSDQDGMEYPVDAGLIGIVDLDEAEKAGWAPPRADLGHVIEFKDSFLAYCEDGKIYFGRICIDTNCWAEDEQ